MQMKNPAHPGSLIKYECLDALGLSVTDAAEHLGVQRSTLSRLINGHSGVSADMAIRLEKAGWSNAAMWLRLQASYDLAQARLHEDEIDVAPFQRV